MTPYYADDWLTVYHGDCRTVMAEMEPESVHCVVTSPPYWGLRDYGTSEWVGGDAECDHAATNGSGRPGRETPGGRGGSFPHDEQPYRHVCGKCGATRIDSQLGLEPTPEEYVANMVAVFREVRRVLRADGTVWLNLGDSYASDLKGSGGNGSTSTLGITGHAQSADGTKRSGDRQRTEPHRVAHGLKPKDLVGIPWRVAFALQADGWYLRSDIIWSKPNPMPESVTDRPTKSHEYLFLLSKSPRYYFDADAVREPALPASIERYRYADGDTTRINKGGAYRDKWNERDKYIGVPTVPDNPAGRNIRSVWTIATAPYPGAHFATFPPKLVEPCIKAGCPAGGTVLDPFAGSGTTGMVAQSLSRRAVLIDLSLDYLGQLMDRNAEIPLGLGA